MRHALLIALTLLAATIPADADQAAVTPQSTPRFGTLRAAQKDPYTRLFEVRDALTQAQQGAAKDAPKEAPKRDVVCGLTIIEADPFFDQKMKVTPPKDPNVRYTIRAVEPSICNPARK